MQYFIPGLQINIIKVFCLLQTRRFLQLSRRMAGDRDSIFILAKLFTIHS